VQGPRLFNDHVPEFIRCLEGSWVHFWLRSSWYRGPFGASLSFALIELVGQEDPAARLQILTSMSPYRRSCLSLLGAPRLWARPRSFGRFMVAADQLFRLHRRGTGPTFIYWCVFDVGPASFPRERFRNWGRLL